MVTNLLVGDLVQEGDALMRQLDLANVPVPSAFWLQNDDYPSPRFFLATPLVDSQGEMAVYTKLREALDKSGAKQLDLIDIGVFSPTNDVIARLRRTTRTGANSIEHIGVPASGIGQSEGFALVLRST